MQSTKQAGPAPASKGPKFRVHIPDDAIIWDGTNAADPHPLTAGILIEPGKVKVTGFKSTLALPIQAWFTPADESADYYADSASTPDTAPDFTWEFVWNELPALGLGAVLRFRDVTNDGSGTTTDVSITTA